MRIGPQLQCNACSMPILLVFTQVHGEERSLSCPACGRTQCWTVLDLVDETSSDDRLGSHRSSVE